MLELDRYEVLTFDCYGTLIDWESGMLVALQSILSAHQIHLPESAILELFAEFEADLEQGEYRPYKQILAGIVQRFGERLGFTPSAAELTALADSVRRWQPFSDTVEALKVLKPSFKLTILSNIDDDLFAATAKHLQVEFDWVVTAEQVGSYKPSLNNFRAAIDRMQISPERILHVACSIYHDVIPASSLSIATVWVNRRLGKPGTGASVAAEGHPDLTVPDLATLAAMARSRHDRKT